MKGHEGVNYPEPPNARKVKSNDKTDTGSSTDCKTETGQTKCHPKGTATMWVPKKN